MTTSQRSWASKLILLKLDVYKRQDKQRANYYNFYTNKKWGSVDSYDFAIDSGSVGVDNTVALIKDFALIRAGRK